MNILEHKQAARNPFFRVVEFKADTEDPTAWGKNLPQLYDGYRRTVDQTRTRYGGSEAGPAVSSGVAFERGNGLVFMLGPVQLSLAENCLLS